MVVDILALFEKVFTKCAEWTDVALGAVGGKGVVLAAFIIVVVVGLLFIPLRGRGFDVSFDDVKDFTRQVTYKGKYSNGKRVKSDPNYKGKYEKRSAGGHRVSPK